MFTQKISMDCTKEQYEKYLKDELLKMGYKEEGVSDWGGGNDYITNYFSSNGEVGNISEQYISADNVTYLGSFNAPLFLALAAMTDKAEGNYGEWFKTIAGEDIWFKIGDKVGILDFATRKATKEEIMAAYETIEKAKEAAKEEIMAKFNTLKSDKINYEVSIDTKGIIADISKALRATEVTEIDAINLLKSKGYKILKPKTWEEV